MSWGIYKIHSAALEKLTALAQQCCLAGIVVKHFQRPFPPIQCTLLGLYKSKNSIFRIPSLPGYTNMDTLDFRNLS